MMPSFLLGLNVFIPPRNIDVGCLDETIRTDYKALALHENSTPSLTRSEREKCWGLLGIMGFCATRGFVARAKEQEF